MNPTRALISALALLTLSACGGSDSGNTSEQLLSELKALRQEVQSLSDDVSKLKNRPTAAPANRRVERPTTSQAPVNTAGYPAQGKADAPVTLVEFSDYQCPFCARHTAQTMPLLVENYVNTGKLRYVFMDNPIPSHRKAAKAAEAAHCAGDQGKYWEMHTAMFGAQVQIGLGKFDEFAQQVGLDAADFSECMKTGRNVAKVNASKQMAAQVGARATPTFVIGKTQPNGVVDGDLLVGAKRYDAFATAINKLLN